jgi:hypothetical protein
MLELGRWGARTMGERAPDQSLRSEWLALGLQAFYRPEAAKGVSATIALRFDDGAFTLALERGRLEITPGPSDQADLTITTDPDRLVGFLSGAPVPVEALRHEGDRDLLERLPEIFAFSALQ